MLNLPTHTERGLTVVVGLTDSTTALDVIARLALRRPVQVIVGGNRFDAHRLARIIRRHTVHLDHTLTRIRQARPFTCHQLLSLLHATRPTTPLVALDLLTTCYDDNISDGESARLVTLVVSHLQRLGRETPVLITLRPLAAPTRTGLVRQVQDVADRLYICSAPEAPIQPPLL